MNNPKVRSFPPPRRFSLKKPVIFEPNDDSKKEEENESAKPENVESGRSSVPIKPFTYSASIEQLSNHIEIIDEPQFEWNNEIDDDSVLLEFSPDHIDFSNDIDALNADMIM